MEIPVRVGNLRQHYLGQHSPFVIALCLGPDSYRLWLNLRIWMIKFVVLGSLNVNHSVDNGVGDMNALGSKFSRQ